MLRKARKGESSDVKAKVNQKHLELVIKLLLLLELPLHLLKHRAQVCSLLRKKERIKERRG